MDLKGESFTSAMTLNQQGVTQVPKRYILQPSQRPNTKDLHFSTNLPIIDLSALKSPSIRSQIISQIHFAFKHVGFFQVINHGIPMAVMENALAAAVEFFNLPMEEKMLLKSDSIHEPVRYGTSINHAQDKVHFWRDFIKHYSYPISKWVHLWPSNPPSYREKMGTYAMAVQELQKQLMEVVLETLGLKADYLRKDVEEGLQVLAVNCYPECPEPELALGMPPHSDYGSLTILLQSSPGLQLLNKDQKWISVPENEEGALMVLLGDQIEVMSNGRYKSVVHRAMVNMEKTRFSIASLHSLGLEKKMGPAPQLVNNENPNIYSEFSAKEFLDFVSTNEIMKGRFIDTIMKGKAD